MAITTQNLPSGINSDHRVYSNYFDDNNIIQNVAIVQPKNLLIDTFRKYFANDNYYTYRANEYGFPLVKDLTDESLDSGNFTKILISDVFRFETVVQPSILTKFTGGSYAPISFNQDGVLKYRKDLVIDTYGSQKVFSTPTHKVYSGAWDMSFDIMIYSRSHSELEEIVEICQMILQYSAYNELRANGLFIKSLNISGESAEPSGTEFIFNQTISIDTRSEWRVEIPIDSLIERIAFYFDIDRHPNLWQKDIADEQNLKYYDIIEISDIEL